MMMERKMRKMYNFLLMVIFLAMFPAVSPLAEEGKVLMSIKASFTGNSSDILRWNEDTQDHCSWRGVRCYKLSSSVMTLMLSNLNLRGRISPAIGDLKKLILLDLGNNYLTGDIPRGIFQNELFEFIALGGNSLSGILSPDLCCLTALKLFDVGSNNITGTIPDNIGNCTNLIVLKLEGNMLNGKIPEVIGLLQSLDFLDLSQNELVGTIPTLLGNLSNTSAIRLHSNKLTGPIPPELGNVSALCYLELNNNQLVGGIPKELGKLGKLIQLNLANNYLGGSIPRTIGSCTSLNLFNVHGNHLNGSIPSELQNLKNLTRLNFSCNNFNGQIPSEIGYNINLDTLDLSSNDFSGPIISFGHLQHLLLLNLSRNRLHGQVPYEFGNYGSIQIIDFSYNQLSGEMPRKLGQLENIDTLILNNNSLSGMIPVELTYCRSLVTLNLSYNNLSGEIPVSRNFSRFPHESFIGNSLLCGHWFNPCGTYSRKSKGISHALVISVIVCPITILIVLCVVILKAYKANQPQQEQSDKTVQVQGPPQPEVITLNDEFFHYIYEEIMMSTENLNDRYVIGKGASGKVFKCESEGLTPIAIKQFKSCNVNSEINQQAKTELEVLVNVNHKNLIKLLGYSFSSTHGFLIFMRYMKNGSLYDALHGPPEKRIHLAWSTRQTIAVGAARGLAYLHEYCKPRRIHRDIKSSNILLDENFEAHIADFAQVRCMADDQSALTTGAGGTCGYIAPECNLNINEKFDVYSFGIVLLELITGKKALVGNGNNLRMWILSEELTEGTIMNATDQVVSLSCTDSNTVWKTYLLACQCTLESPSSRPPMSLVVAHLASLLLDPE